MSATPTETPTEIGVPSTSTGGRSTSLTSLLAVSSAPGMPSTGSSADVICLAWSLLAALALDAVVAYFAS